MTEADRDFYSTAAQVLPVLFLLAAVERRVIGRSRATSFPWFVFDLVATPVVILAMGAGEVAALWALEIDTSTDVLLLLTVISLVVSGSAVLIEAIAGTFDAMERRAPEVHWVPAVKRAKAVTVSILAALLAAAIVAVVIVFWPL
jgi:uncharacterized membrane protein